MQDVQNIPPPDINSAERDNEFGNHSAIDVDLDGEDLLDEMPLPSDQPPPAPISVPHVEDRFPITENNPEPKIIV